MDPNQSYNSFIFPYTELTPNEMQALVTAAILFDDVSYLDYDAQCGKPKPIKRKIEEDKSSMKGNDCLRILDYLEESNILNPIHVSNLFWEYADANKLVEKMFCNLVKQNLNELRTLGITDPIGPSYQLSIQKLYPCIANAVGIDYSKLSDDVDDVDVGFIEGESILLAYTEFITKIRNMAPFALDQLHAETLKHIYNQKVHRISSRNDDIEIKYFGNLIAAKFEILKTPWLLKPSEIGRLRRETANIRNKIHQGIGQLFKEHLERIDILNYETLTEITKEDIGSLDELEEEYKKSVKTSKDLTPVEFITCGALGVSVGAVVGIPLGALTAPIGPFIGAVGIGIAAKIADIAAQEFLKIKRVPDPLMDTIAFIHKIGEII